MDAVRNPITFIAWRRYLGNPRDTSFGIDDYDHFPKGTGFFFAPRERLLELCASFDSSYDDVAMASDDTLLIRPLAASDRINIAPELGGVYFPRDDFASFLRHTYFRGTTSSTVTSGQVPDSNGLFWIGLAIAPVVAMAVASSPKRSAQLAGLGLGVVPFVAMRRRGALRRRRLFRAHLPVFAVTYAAGIVRGLRLRRASGGTS